MQSHRSWHSAFLFLASHQLCIWKEAMTTFAFQSISKRTRLPSGTTYSHHRFLLFEAQATVSGEQACTADVCFLSFFFHFLKIAESLCFTSASKFSVNRSSAGNLTRIWRSIFIQTNPFPSYIHLPLFNPLNHHLGRWFGSWNNSFQPKCITVLWLRPLFQ